MTSLRRLLNVYRCKNIRQKEKDVDWVHCLLDSLTSNVDIILFDFLYSLYAVTLFFIRNSSIRNTTENLQTNKKPVLAFRSIKNNCHSCC